MTLRDLVLNKFFLKKKSQGFRLSFVFRETGRSPLRSLACFEAGQSTLRSLACFEAGQSSRELV